jgi:O-antigen/teichoic acid export membrane protein
MSRFTIDGRTLARNGLLNLAGQGLPFLVGLASVPAIVHGLGTERFGILGLMWAFFSAVSVFDLGLGRAVTKFVAEALGTGDPRRIPGIIWAAVAGQAALGTIIGGLLTAAAPPLVGRFLNVVPDMREEAVLAFRVLALSLPVVLVSLSFQGALEAAQRFGVLTGIKTLSGASMFLVPLLGVFLGWDLPAILGALLAVRTVVLTVLLFSCVRVFATLRGFGRVDRQSLRPLFGFGGWIAVSGLLALLLTSADRFVIGNLITMTAVAHYTLPKELISRVGIVTTSLAVVLFPAFSTLGGARDHGRLRLLFSRATKYMILTIGPLYGLVAVFAPDLFTVWLGRALAAQSAPVLRILAAGAALQLVTTAAYVLIQGLGRSDLTAKFHLLEAPLYLIAMWWLVQLWGIRGAAWAWSGRVALDVFLLLIATRRMEVWTWPAAGRAARSVALPPAVLCALLVLCYSLPVALVLKAALTGALFLLFGWWVWTRSLEDDERRWMYEFVSGWRAAVAKPQ